MSLSSLASKLHLETIEVSDVELYPAESELHGSASLSPNVGQARRISWLSLLTDGTWWLRVA